MEQNKNKAFDLGTDPYFEEVQAQTKFSFDFVLWFYRILKYWYLFVISLSLFLGYAYLKNKSWTPIYRSGAVLMMESRGGGVGSGAVNLGSLVRNTINQQMVLNSYDMVVKTVARLPQMRVDYFTKTKFKTNNLYGRTPIEIEAKFVQPSVYSQVFNIEPIDSEKCRIYYEGTEKTPPFSMEVAYGQFIQEPRFYIKVNKTDRFTPNFEPFSFRFVSTDELAARFSGRVHTYQTREGSSALSINMVGQNPAQDVDFLKELLFVFQEYNLSLKNEAADQTIAFIDKQLQIITDSLRHSESVFHNFQEETGLYKLENGDRRIKKDGIYQSLAELKAEEDMVLILTEDINTAILGNTELVDPSTLGLSDSKLSAFVKDYNTTISKVNSIGEAHPLYERSAKSLTEQRIKILNELRNIQDKIQNQKETLEDGLTKLDQEISTMPSQEREYVRYERVYQTNEKYQAYLEQRRYEATLGKASNIPDNFTMEEPRLLGGPINGDEKSKNYTFFFLIGLALPLAFVVCKEEVFNYAISTKEECEKLSGLPVIGTIENISKKMSNGGSVLVKNFPKSSFAESFRNMRIRIEYIAQRESKISVLVTSAEPGDGKTFIAGNIASVYQLTGKKVVLVDFDLRRPSVAKLLNLESKKGVSNFLIGQVTLDEITITHPEYEFDVITAGTLPPNPSELIKTQRTKDLINYLQNKYDYVVIDCSPIGLVSDAYILSKLVDSTLFVVRRAKTNKAFFKSVVSQMRNDGLEHAALIFNDVKGREGYYGTSRYYGDKSYYLKRNSYYHDDYFEK